MTTPTRRRRTAPARALVAALVVASLPIGAPAATADEPAFHAFDNGRLRFGTGVEASVNAFGNLQQPFYFDTAIPEPEFLALTYASHPLDLAIGVGGDGSDEWNVSGDVVDNPALRDQVVDTGGFVATAVEGDGVRGHGRIVSTGEVTIGATDLRLRTTYRLGAEASYVRITTSITNLDDVVADNLRLWVGTQDDWVGFSDHPTKTRGTLGPTGFEPLSDPTDRSPALRITSEESGVLFFTESPLAYTSIARWGSFENVRSQDPRETAIEVTNDGSYALFLRLDDLEPGASQELTWYYAAGEISQLDRIADEVSDEVVNGPTPDPTPDPDPTPAPRPTPVPTPEGRLPAPTVGRGDATVDGERLPVTVGRAPNGSGLTVRGRAPGGQDFAMEVDAPRAASKVPVAGAELSFGVRRGDDARVKVSGFRPDSPVRLWLLSDPLLLGDFTTTAAGALDGAIATIPAGVSACRHTLHAVGTLPDGQELAVSLGVWVRAERRPFTDAALGSTHTAAIGCLADLGIARGTTAGTYEVDASVTRAQAASLLARTLGLDTRGRSTFTDTRTSGHDGAIGALERAGLVRGTGQGRFGPTQPLQRGQFASMLAAAGQLDTTAPSTFPDTSGTRHAGAIVALTDRGVISGFDDGTFRPAAPITRGQFASMTVRSFELLGVETR